MSTSNTIVETYRGTEITFGGDGWVNATQMAKPFGKRPSDFLKLPVAKEYIAALARDLGASGENLHLAKHGGVSPGTWMHPDLALEFARWLSPEFAIWCNRIVRRVLNGGQASVESATMLNMLQQVVASVAQMGTTVAALHARVERMETHGLASSAPAPLMLKPLPSGSEEMDLRVGRLLVVILEKLTGGRTNGPIPVQMRDIAVWAVELGTFEDLSDWNRHSFICRLAHKLQPYLGRPVPTWESRQHFCILTAEGTARNGGKRYIIRCKPASEVIAA